MADDRSTEVQFLLERVAVLTALQFKLEAKVEEIERRLAQPVRDGHPIWREGD